METDSFNEGRHPLPAVAAVIIQDGKILLVRRGVEPSRDKWSIPGGSIEWGEPMMEAVKREVREETGLEVEPERIAGVFDLIIRSKDGAPKFHYVIVDVLARLVGGELAPGDDAIEAMWVPLEQIENYDLSAFLLSRLKQMRIL